MNYNHHQEQQLNNVVEDDEITSSSSGLILQDVCTSLTQNLQMQSINSFQHLSSQYIEQIVEIEMKRLKANCNQEEQNYVEQMLLENPIIVERRNAPPPTTQINHNDVTNNNHNPNVQDVTADDDEDDTSVYMQQQQQRSESCRRSRLNNKIKKAKAKYRHKFMSNKLLHSANVLECLQKLIEQTENQLINQGFNALQLLELRKVFYNNFMIGQ